MRQVAVLVFPVPETDLMALIRITGMCLSLLSPIFAYSSLVSQRIRIFYYNCMQRYKKRGILCITVESDLNENWISALLVIRNPPLSLISK